MLYTNNYGLNMPEYMESADIRDLNENAETIDTLLHSNFTNSADAYDSTQTYAVGDIVIYENKLYRCTTAVATAESFDNTKWTQTSLGGILETTNERFNNISQVLSIPYNKKLVLHRETITSRFGFMMGEIFPPASDLGVITLWGYGGNTPNLTQRTNIIETRAFKYLTTTIPGNNTSLDIVSFANSTMTYPVEIFVNNLTGNAYTYTIEDIS